MKILKPIRLPTVIILLYSFAVDRWQLYRYSAIICTVYVMFICIGTLTLISSQMSFLYIYIAYTINDIKILRHCIINHLLSEMQDALLCATLGQIFCRNILKWQYSKWVRILYWTPLPPILPVEKMIASKSLGNDDAL